MRYQHVCLETAVTQLPPHVVSSEEIEEQLSPVYDRLGLPAGRLELMTGIRERRFFDSGTKPGEISSRTVRHALEVSGLNPLDCEALLHGSVCRDQMEPATAAGVHAAAGLPNTALVMDVSNACLGLLNGALVIADLIELGRIGAGIAVGTEIGRPLVEGTINKLLHDPAVTRKSIKLDFASLTIGSGSAALVLCHERLSRTGHRFLGGAVRANTAHHNLCAGGVNSAAADAEGRPLMSTDSEALLHAGIELAEETWQHARTELEWTNDSVDKIFTHQVGKAHRQLLLERLKLDPERDHPTVEFLGNTGAAALPTALALGIEQNDLKTGDRVALLGIGSGLNCVMLGLEW